MDCPTLPIPCLLILWRLFEPKHQQAWHWTLKPEYSVSSIRRVNTLRPRKSGRHFADDIFKCISFNGNGWIVIKISVKFITKGPITCNNIPALIQIMAWRRAGDKPLSESMVVRLPTHICVIPPQWVKRAIRTYAGQCHYNAVNFLPNVCWWLILPIASRVTSLALRQSCSCPNAHEAILKNMG